MSQRLLNFTDLQISAGNSEYTLEELDPNELDQGLFMWIIFHVHYPVHSYFSTTGTLLYSREIPHQTWCLWWEAQRAKPC